MVESGGLARANGARRADQPPSMRGHTLGPLARVDLNCNYIPITPTTASHAIHHSDASACASSAGRLATRRTRPRPPCPSSTSSSGGACGALNGECSIHINLQRIRGTHPTTANDTQARPTAGGAGVPGSVRASGGSRDRGQGPSHPCDSGMAVALGPVWQRRQLGHPRGREPPHGHLGDGAAGAKGSHGSSAGGGHVSAM